MKRRPSHTRAQRDGAAIRKLRDRLTELEEVLRAIRSGDVDALVVEGPHGDQVYSVTNADQPYRIFVESMQEGAVTLSTEGDILFCNRRFAEMVDMPLERVIGGEMRRFIAPDDHAAFTGLLQTRSGKQQLMLQAADRRSFAVALAASPFVIGDVPSICVVVTDLTQQREEEARTRQLVREQIARAEAETENRTKDEFLAVLSHELRTPLTAILGWVRMLRTRALEPDKVAHALEVIERNGRTQTALITDLLDVSRIVTGKLSVARERLALAPVVESAVETLRPVASAKEVTVAVAMNAFTAEVDGDAERLRQVVVNLLSNALKFTPPGGHVSVTLDATAEAAILSVSDNGRGIAPDFRAHIFEPFRQADSSITRAEGGLGLGLAIARHLVEAHGGTISVHSDGEGLGATFTVALPLTEPTPALGRTDRQRPPRSVHGVRVLLVDDHLDTLDVLSNLLALEGAVVRAAQSVRQALEILEGFIPDAIICDVSMPEEGGLSFIAKLRNGPSADLPAIALSAYARPEDEQRALDAGFDGHLAKPADPADLVDLLARTIAARKTRTSRAEAR